MALVNALFIGLFVGFLQTQSWALSTSYSSAEDEDISIKKLLVTVGRDNVQGIYARPLADHLSGLVTEGHFFEVVPAAEGSSFELDSLRTEPQKTSDLAAKGGADAILHLQVAKGQMGLRLELGLFTKKSGLLWAYADYLEKQKFDLTNVQEVVTKLYQQIINQVPYQGLLLSRTGNKVTLNRGLLANIKPDQEIDVVQILGVERHPEFRFVTHVQKEILGKIRITKVDETLSFGYILFEKEPQAVQTGMKLLIREPVFYPNLANSKNESVVDHLLARSDGSVVMKGDAKEWLPAHSPTFGRLDLLFGLGDFDASSNLETAGNQEAATSMALNAQLSSDIWLTRSWFLRLGLNQGSAQVKNPLADSAPKKLHFALQNTRLGVGYDLAVVDSLYGPRLQMVLGYSQFSLTPTESNPVSFTTNIFDGTAFGLIGFMPLNEYESKWGFGAELWYHYYPNLDEKPLTSGDSEDSNITELAGVAYYQWNQNIYWITKLGVNSFKTKFKGKGSRTDSATSSDFSWRYLNAGVEFLF